MRVDSVFLSVARGSLPKAALLLTDLRSLGYDVALDSSVPGGTAWWSDLTQRIADADVFMYGITGETLDSDVCQVELDFAVTLHKPLVPVTLEDEIAPSSLPPQIGHLQLIDYRTADRAAVGALFHSLSLIVPVRHMDVVHEVPALPPTLARSVFDDLQTTDYLAPAEQSRILARLFDLRRLGYDRAQLDPLINMFLNRREMSLHSKMSLDELKASASLPMEEPDRADEVQVGHGQAGVESRSLRSFFVSYSRADKNIVGGLIADLKQLGLEVWYDQDIPGAEPWWQKILQSVRASDGFVFAASSRSISSDACRSELTYALMLGKPAIRIDVQPDVDPTEALADVKNLRVCDYTSNSKEGMCVLARTIRGLSLGVLPDPLPPPPAIPQSYVFNVRTLIRSGRYLSPEDQERILDLLEQHANEGIRHDELQPLLAQYSQREDFIAHYEERVRALARRLELAEGELFAVPDRSSTKNAAAEEQRRRTEEAQKKAAAEEQRRRSEEAQTRAAADEQRRRSEEAQTRAAADEQRRRSEEAQTRAAADEQRRKTEEAGRIAQTQPRHEAVQANYQAQTTGKRGEPNIVLLLFIPVISWGVILVGLLVDAENTEPLGTSIVLAIGALSLALGLWLWRRTPTKGT